MPLSSLENEGLVEPMDLISSQPAWHCPIRFVSGLDLFESLCIFLTEFFQFWGDRYPTVALVRVLAEIALVIFLGREEGGQGFNLRYDGVVPGFL